MIVAPEAPRAFAHASVLLERVLEIFEDVPAGTVLDATLGGAGHAAALLEARPDLRILGLDQDPFALVAAQARLAPFGERAVVHRARFDRLAAVVAAAGATVQPMVGVLFDLGVSSPQLDVAERGFSLHRSGPLDMRMDPDGPRTAADLVNELLEGELAQVLTAGGEDRFARRIARGIVAARPIATTTELAEVVRDSVPAAARRRPRHPAVRTFQALRIAVNEELDLLPGSIDAAIDVTAPGGRVAVISFHSGEDRIAKQRFRWAETGGCTCPPGLPCGCGAVPTVRLLSRGGWVPSEEEIAANPRAASARIRAVEKLPTVQIEDQP